MDYQKELKCGYSVEELLNGILNEVTRVTTNSKLELTNNSSLSTEWKEQFMKNFDELDFNIGTDVILIKEALKLPKENVDEGREY